MLLLLMLLMLMVMMLLLLMFFGDVVIGEKDWLGFIRVHSISKNVKNTFS